MKPRAFLVLCIATMVLLPGPGVFAGPRSTTELPRPLVDSYDSLADVLLGAKKTEWNLVHSILATIYGHAEASYAAAQAKLAAGQDAAVEIENLAALVSQLANEGDASVAAVRKRLIDAGHHHHAAAGENEKYDPGFVIVTRTTKKSLLEAAGRIGKLAASPDAAALESQWTTVRKLFKGLHEGAGV